jgi:hypothetical protein
VDEIPRVPYFGLQFALMIFGALLLLISGALVRNALDKGRQGLAINLALESREWFLVPIGFAMLIVLYPFKRDRYGERFALRPYLLFLLSCVLFFGPLVFWAWWYGDIPGVAALGARG